MKRNMRQDRLGLALKKIIYNKGQHISRIQTSDSNVLYLN